MASSSAAMTERRISRVVIGLWCAMMAGCATAPHEFLPLAPTPPPPRTGGIYHRVERSQTLWSVAQRYHVSLDALVDANHLESPQRIAVGQQIWIPGISKELLRLPSATPEMDSASGFQWPVRGQVIATFGSMQAGSTNRGVDIRVARGSPVRAARAGHVVFVDANMPGNGKTVILDHGDGFSTVYAWNGELLVQLGQAVSRATPIATVGATGRAGAPALHFEVRKSYVPQNPFYFLPSS